MTPPCVLVTGASGFVGVHLARALAEAGRDVHGAGTEPPPPGFPFAAWHKADVRDGPRLAAAIEAAGPEAIVHLAGQSSAARSFTDPEETFRVNAVGTWNLLQAVARAAPRARVLAVGSGEVYGPQPEGTRADERTLFRPVSPYALSKAAADAYAAEASRRGLDVVRTRSFGHTGPGQAPRFAVPSWAHQIAAIEAGAAEPVLRVGNLDVTRDLTDVRDVVRAYLALLDRGRAGAAYNVCRGEGVRLDEVLEALRGRARVAVRVERDPARMRPADLPHLVGDPTAIHEATGWRAEIELERTLDDVLDDARARVGPTSRA